MKTKTKTPPRPAHVIKADLATDRLVFRLIDTLHREEDARQPVVSLTEEQRQRHARVVDLVRLSRRKALRRARGRTAS